MIFALVVLAIISLVQFVVGIYADNNLHTFLGALYLVVLVCVLTAV